MSCISVSEDSQYDRNMQRVLTRTIKIVMPDDSKNVSFN